MEGVFPFIEILVAAFHQESVSVPEIALVLVRRSYAATRPVGRSAGLVQASVI